MSLMRALAAAVAVLAAGAAAARAEPPIPPTDLASRGVQLAPGSLRLASLGLIPPLRSSLDLAPRPPADRDEEGPFLGARYRYGNGMNVIERVAWDVIAIPANAPRWDAGDWAITTAFAGSILALMWPAEPSPDVRIDRWITQHVNPWMPMIWTDAMQVTLWGTLAIGSFGGWWWAATHDQPRIAEGFSLAGESVAVFQAYHLAFKFFIGREGPGNGSNEGRVLGPGKGLKYYPAGTPSGHAGTLFAVLSSSLAYYDPPVWVDVLGYGVLGFVVGAHVLDHRHYLSESIWGSAMGWGVGRWVVRHRRSLPEEREERLRAEVVPLALGRGSFGLGLVGTF
jgi:hypothetical protein